MTKSFWESNQPYVSIVDYDFRTYEEAVIDQTLLENAILNDRNNILAGMDILLLGYYNIFSCSLIM